MYKRISANQLSDNQITVSKFIHEIRNPLTLVSCELQILTQKHPETNNWNEITQIQEHLIYIKDLISAFSDYNNARKLNLKTTDISSFLSDVANAFRTMFEYLKIRFITNFPSDLPKISADTLRLRQALTNILRNAEESISHDHGEIIFSAKLIMADSSPAIVISVTDNGSGIEPEYIPDLGTPFITHKENGTGLGLSVVREITEAHGGSVKIESIPLQGTTVHLYLPVSRMINQEG